MKVARAVIGAAFVVAVFWVCVALMVIWKAGHWPAFTAREAALTVGLTAILSIGDLWLKSRKA